MFNNRRPIGIAFPENQVMRVYARLWNANDWTTKGVWAQIDWFMAPLAASYRNFNT